jgi:hypothetical protein
MKKDDLTLGPKIIYATRLELERFNLYSLAQGQEVEFHEIEIGDRMICYISYLNLFNHCLILAK